MSASDRFPGTEPALYGRLTHDKALEKVFQDCDERYIQIGQPILAQSHGFQLYSSWWWMRAAVTAPMHWLLRSNFQWLKLAYSILHPFANTLNAISSRLA